MRHETGFQATVVRVSRETFGGAMFEFTLRIAHAKILLGFAFELANIDFPFAAHGNGNGLLPLQTIRTFL